MNKGFALIWGKRVLPHAKFHFGVSRAQQGLSGNDVKPIQHGRFWSFSANGGFGSVFVFTIFAVFGYTLGHVNGVLTPNLAMVPENVQLHCTS